MSAISTGVRDVTSQIEPYTKWWDDQNKAALDSDADKLLFIVGDSTALGIGATAPELGYVGLIKNHLNESTNDTWRVIVQCMSGAKVDDAIKEYLPALANLPEPDLTICCIGSNDIFWSASIIHVKLKLMIDGLPQNSIVGSLAGGSPRSFAANRVLKKASLSQGFKFVNPWGLPTPSGLKRVAEDKFHPNNLGYELMAEAFIEAIK